MKTLTCAAARRHLAAFHDRELSTSDQIAIAGHLDVCRDCAARLAEVDLIGAGLRSMAQARCPLTRDDAIGFHAGVVNRVKAEREASFVVRVRAMFDDMHLVYAGVGATVATMVCVVIMLSMMRFASSERPDSLAAMVACLAVPGSNANAVAIDPESHARWTARFSAANESAEQETVFALAEALTRDGRDTKLEPLHAAGRRTVQGETDAKLIEGLLDAVSRARFGPPQAEGLPASGSMVWLIAHTTVRASQSATTAADLPLPTVPAKKRAAFRAAPRPIVA
jgi:putative zinc finger protein